MLQRNPRSQYQFNFARTRIEALAKLEKDRYHLELVDIRMPDGDLSKVSGLNLLKEVGSKYPDLISVVLSAFGSDVETRENQEIPLRVVEFVNKPIDFSRLKEIFAKYLPSPQSASLQKTHENQEKKIHYNTVFKLVRELNSDLNYKLTIENIKRFELDQFEALRKNLPILEAQVREEQERREFLIQRDIEREKQGKLPLLPLIEGAIDPRRYNSKSKSGEIKRYRYFYLRLPNPNGGYISQPIDKEHLNDPDVREIIERKLGKPIDPEFL
ncbi:MAG: response regulator [Hydrococcus sp. RU_2_2]|nr:response regulator [Hydrococcus sp. RU_2_2]NJP22117.1 response regulator [Hydrococcus sp. CRU_1_1]